jgi:hypothetical protein
MSERCSVHPRYSEDDCSECRKLLDRKRALASDEELCELCSKHPGFSRVVRPVCHIAANRAYAQEHAAKKAAGENTESFEQWIEGISSEKDDDPSNSIEVPRRRFFQPLPEGSLPLWPKTLDGMTPRNIAMFLCMPEFIYTDYEQNKNNPPKWILVTAEESINRTEIKLSGDVRNVQQVQNHAEQYSVSPVDDSIRKRADPIVIHVVEKSKTIRRKIPPPPDLVRALKDAEGIELERLTAKWNKEHGSLTPKELASARTRQYRKIAKLKKEVAVYDRPQVVESSREWDIVIPPCPEGCDEIFKREAIRAYVTEAFNTTDYANWDDWRFTALENKVIQVMYEKNLFRGWPNKRAPSLWLVSGRPSHGDPGWNDFFGWYENGAEKPIDFEPDMRAHEIAMTGYRRRADGSVPDETIRRVSPATRGGRYGAGHGADSDERRDSPDYRKESDREKKKFGE